MFSDDHRPLSQPASAERGLCEDAADFESENANEINTPEARQVYSQRLAIVEPVFANLRHNKGLSRFTYRTRKKVTTQWRLYCLVHNVEKLVRRSRSFGRPKPAK